MLSVGAEGQRAENLCLNFSCLDIKYKIAAMKLRRLLLGRKTMTNLDSILKSRDITLTTKVRLFRTIVFPRVVYGCES